MLKRVDDLLGAKPAPAIAYEPVSDPIGRVGAIGDGRTLALVRDDGSIPYLCWPRFDAPSMLHAMLSGDAAAHAAFTFDRTTEAGEQAYEPSTNVLSTRFERAVLTDAMAVDGPQALVRVVEATGTVRLGFHIGPRPDHGRREAVLRTIGPNAVRVGGGEPFAVAASFPLRVDGAAIVGDATMDAGDRHWVAFFDPRSAFDPDRFDPAETLEAARAHWRERAARLSYDGAGRAVIERSALALALLEDRRSGALMAAGTFGFPEAPNGARNWDYRYAWTRDTAFAASAAARAGLAEDAARWLRFAVMENSACERSPLRIMQTADGEAAPDEHELKGWQGLFDARPVLVGNDAEHQLQLDMFGEVIVAMQALADGGHRFEPDVLERVRELLDWLKVHWRDADSSIWELRGGEKRYLFSALMCWRAFTEATPLFERHGAVPDAAWAGYADKAAAAIRADYWCPNRESYMQTSECSVVDAAVVMMRVCGFLGADDPRWLSSKKAVREDLLRPHPDPWGLLRFPHDADDGFAKDEGTFVLCTGWWIHALWMDGDRDEARAAWARLLDHVPATGIMSEEVGEDGILLGNIPQAFSHAALIDCALLMDGAEA